MRQVRKGSTKDGWYEITPADAARLRADGHKNRPLRESRAKLIAGRIKDKAWAENGESFVLDSDDRMLDGQHRARAIELADQSVVAYFVHLDRPGATVFDSIDQGSPRTSADRLALDGVRYYATIAAMTRLMIDYERGVTSSVPASSGEIRRRYQRDQEAVDASAEFVTTIPKDPKRLLAPSIAGFVHYMAKKTNPDKADRFMSSMFTGEQLTRGNSVFHLRSRLLDQLSSKEKLPAREALALAIRAWVYYVNGKSVTFVRWHSESPFPRFDDAPTERRT